MPKPVEGTITTDIATPPSSLKRKVILSFIRQEIDDNEDDFVNQSDKKKTKKVVTPPSPMNPDGQDVIHSAGLAKKSGRPAAKKKS